MAKNKENFTWFWHLNALSSLCVRTWCCRILSSCAERRRGSVRLPSSPGQSTAISRCCCPPLRSSSPPPSPATWPFRWEVVIPRTHWVLSVFESIRQTCRFSGVYVGGTFRRVTQWRGQPWHCYLCRKQIQNISCLILHHTFIPAVVHIRQLWACKLQCLQKDGEDACCQPALTGNQTHLRRCQTNQVTFHSVVLSSWWS